MVATWLIRRGKNDRNLKPKSKCSAGVRPPEDTSLTPISLPLRVIASSSCRRDVVGMVIDRHEETSRWRQQSGTMLGMRHSQCHAHRVTIPIGQHIPDGTGFE